MLWLVSACVDRPIDQSTETGPPGQEGTSTATGASTSTGDPPTPTTRGPGPDEPSSSSTAEPTSSTASTGETEPSCGDGNLDAGEVCDDGNPLDGDGCNADCDVSGRLLWQRLSGATGRDTYHDVVALPDGRIFVGGAVHPAGGTQDRWLLGLDATGAPTWERRLDAGDAIEQALAVAADEAGLYAAGSIAGGDDHDLWIGRFMLDGATLWEETVSSGLGPDLATDLTLLPSAGVVVAGRLATDGGPALWLRSYSPSGEVQWTQTVAPTSPIEYPLGPGIITATDQLVAGFVDGDGAALLLGATLAGGEPLWAHSSALDSAILDVAPLAASDVVFTGRQLGDQLFVGRRAVGGAQAWTSSDCSGAIGHAVAVDGRDDIVVVGVSHEGPDGDVRLCKFSPAGALRWSQTVDGTFGDDAGHALAIVEGEQILVAGEHDLGGGQTDGWLAMFAP